MFFFTWYKRTRVNFRSKWQEESVTSVLIIHKTRGALILHLKLSRNSKRPSVIRRVFVVKLPTIHSSLPFCLGIRSWLQGTGPERSLPFYGFYHSSLASSHLQAGTRKPVLAVRLKTKVLPSRIPARVRENPQRQTWAFCRAAV